MGFVEIDKTGQHRKHNVDAIYTVTPKKGQGTLKITSKGVDFLLTNLLEQDINKPFKVFIDNETMSLAFKQDEDGKFKLRKGKGKQYSLTYQDINKQISKPTQYLMELSKDYTFVLVPVKDSQASEAQAVQATEAPKAEVEAAQIPEVQAETEKPSAKGKRKPKSK